MKRHKHYDCIIALAKGAEIEHLNRHGIWEYIKYPSWHDDFVYRIKPEPKPDVVLYAYSKNMKNENAYLICAHSLDYFKKNIENEPNIKLLYDGETKELKSAEKI